ncbi:restriction endonuclease [Lentilactobacillus hilgardii]|uniref:restriction endonuclease n=1 Tax=Lentilactobacillus hilgardii TaxID=1588 RepID=UPI0021C49231|nr:restriction endonuclease [Lentilactobacillus hilgardii]MCP9333141.1 restriction endonuclease [Lentilactobacillus hilgardii]MCP9349762.1 restriction endonuclease [Lentilactobacillus hilgardii]MCP9352690.1 restriction endonuclease [Lentilactobacillus hilgardii]
MVVNQNISGMPDWDKTVTMTLTVVNERDSWHRVELRKKVADDFKLPDKVRYRNYPKNPKNIIIENRIGWALSDLAISGAIERPQQGIYRITTLGKRLLAERGMNLTLAEVSNLPMFQEHQKEVAERRKRKGKISMDTLDDVEDTADISEVLADKSDKYNIEVKTELLRQIMNSDPIFFEHLVVRLLSKMGYKGPNGSATVTPASGDDGIDGIINQDPLGTNTVYVQAKRYAKDNRVQRPQIQSFYGAIKGRGAESGVFITTSDFSRSAREYAENFRIVLVDGIELTDLMLEYEVGVQVKSDYKLYEIDNDFFD